MLPFWTDQYGNPHSRTHFFGWESDDAVEVARKQVPHQALSCHFKGKRMKFPKENSLRRSVACILGFITVLLHAGGRSHRRRPEGDHLHIWRNRVEQPRAEGLQFHPPLHDELQWASTSRPAPAVSVFLKNPKLRRPQGWACMPPE